MKKGLFSLLIVALVLQSVIFSVQADPLVERSYTQETTLHLRHLLKVKMQCWSL